jgi:hypothetical protein
MYLQLKELHDTQLENLLFPGMVVYRGAVISEEELKGLKVKGNLFITRSFLSTTVLREVADVFSSKDTETEIGKSVLISIRIDHMEMEEKPIAYLGELSQMPAESEIMLSMGMVLRVETSKKIKANSKYTWEIQLFRGKDEAKIEKDLSRFPDLAQETARGLFLGMDIFLAATDNGRHLGEFSKSITHPLNSLDISAAGNSQVTPNGNDPSQLVSS